MAASSGASAPVRGPRGRSARSEGRTPRPARADRLQRKNRQFEAKMAGKKSL